MRGITIESYLNNYNLNKYLSNIDKDTTYFVSKDEDVVTCIVEIKYLDWDSKIFNKKIGLFRIKYGELNKEILNEVDNFCIEKKYKCLFTKATTREYSKMHSLENCGFNIMDSIVTLKMEMIDRPNIIVDCNFKCRILEESDLPSITDIIDNLYSFGRFFEDSTLDNKNVNTLYKQWITNEVRNENIDVVGIEYKNELVGFISCKYSVSKINDEKEGIISLVGIDKSYQGLGIGKKLINYVLSSFYDNKVKVVYVGTQIDNIGALNLYISSGFRIQSSSNSFHKHYNYQLK